MRDDVGLEKIAARVKKPLKDIKVAAYYGCTLLRPQVVAIDSVERPLVLQDVLSAVGATAVEFPFATECCGAYQVVNNRVIVSERTAAILDSAAKNGAEAVAVSCPLCEYNLRQVPAGTDHAGMPIFYFTQLMALAFGLGPEVCGFEENSPQTRSWLKSKGLTS